MGLCGPRGYTVAGPVGKRIARPSVRDARQSAREARWDRGPVWWRDVSAGRLHPQPGLSVRPSGRPGGAPHATRSLQPAGRHDQRVDQARGRGSAAGPGGQAVPGNIGALRVEYPPGADRLRGGGRLREMGLQRPLARGAQARPVAASGRGDRGRPGGAALPGRQGSASQPGPRKTGRQRRAAGDRPRGLGRCARRTLRAVRPSIEALWARSRSRRVRSRPRRSPPSLQPRRAETRHSEPSEEGNRQ